jgi:hypothetical protein
MRPIQWCRKKRRVLELTEREIERKERKKVRLATFTLIFLMFGSFLIIIPTVQTQDPPPPPTPFPVNQTVPLEGNLTFTFYPDESIKMKVIGSIEQAIETYSPPPVYNAYLNLASSPSGVNLTDVTGTFVLKLNPMYSMLLAALELDLEAHAEGLSSNSTILFNMPGYLGVNGTTGAFTDESTGEDNFDFDLTITIWYSLLPEEEIQGFIETFPTLESQIVTQISELMEGNVTLQDLTYSGETGFASATITISGSLVGDFVKGGTALSTNLLPLLGIEYPETTPLISPEELMYTKAKSADIHIWFDRDEFAFLMDSEGVIEGDLDRQINIMKDIYLEQIARARAEKILQFPDTPPELVLMINDVLIPTEISTENLNVIFEYSFDEENIKLDFVVDGLVLRPPTTEAFLTLLDKALAGGSLPSFSLIFEGGSDEERFVEIEVSPTTSYPAVLGHRRVVWIVDNLENLGLVSLDVREWPTQTLTVSQTEVVVGDTVDIEGVVSIEGESMEGQEVDLAVNDVVMGTVVAGEEGVFSFTYTFDDAGSYEVKSSCEFYEKTLESPITTVTVKSPPLLPSGLVAPVIGITVAVVVAGYMLMKRR